MVRFEEFEFPFFEDRTPPILVAQEPDGRQEVEPAGAVRTLTYSGSGDVTGRLRPVNLQLGEGPPATSTSGCEAADFAGFERGSVALIRRGTCPFQAKVENAVAAGAVGVVIMNEGTNSRTDVFSGLMNKPAAIPVVGVSYERGRSLDIASRADGGATVHLAVDALTGKRSTRNVLAETPSRGDGPLIIVAVTGEGLAGMVRRQFLADFHDHDLAVQERTGGRFGSDDSAFSQKGVPTVGLYTGAGAPKSEGEAKLFGGAAGRPLDPCYHRACDTTENIDQEVLEQNTRALVRVLRAVEIAAPTPSAPAQNSGGLPDRRR